MATKSPKISNSTKVAVKNYDDLIKLFITVIKARGVTFETLCNNTYLISDPTQLVFGKPGSNKRRYAIIRVDKLKISFEKRHRPRSRWKQDETYDPHLSLLIPVRFLPRDLGTDTAQTNQSNRILDHARHLQRHLQHKWLLPLLQHLIHYLLQH